MGTMRSSPVNNDIHVVEVESKVLESRAFLLPFDHAIRLAVHNPFAAIMITYQWLRYCEFPSSFVGIAQ